MAKITGLVLLGSLASASGMQFATGDLKSTPIKGGLAKGKWWQRELKDVQPLCKKADPNDSGTCHQWTSKLSSNAQEAVTAIKEAVSAQIEIQSNTKKHHRVLRWNDQMDELYLSSPKHAEGSDRVFITPHIDGFLGWIPFMVNYRCVYGLTGPHDTVTIQPMQDPEDRELILGPGKFTCFDYNREIHWIEHVQSSNHTLDERMVLKLHFYEYPALLEYIGHAFGDANAQYNFFARRAFLVSQFPDRSAFARFVARIINSITLFGGSAEAAFGYMNIGIALALIFAAKGKVSALLRYAGTAHFLVYILAFTFRAVKLGSLVRDCVALKSVSSALLIGTYAWESAQNGVHWLSTVVAIAGFSVSALAFSQLGANLAYFGQELGAVDPQTVTAFPYGTIPHPMILGSIVGLTGLRMHPTYGPKFHSNYLLHVTLYSIVLALEVFDLHLPADMTYDKTFTDFMQYHQDPTNVFVHLATTLLGVFGLFGLILNAGSRRSAAAAGSPTKGVKKGQARDNSTSPTLLALGWTWILVRYTVPDEDVAYIVTGLVTALTWLVSTLKPSNTMSVVALAIGMGGQELAHHLSKEVTFMASYAEVTPAAALTFVLHNIWLLPFEMRAALGALTEMAAPTLEKMEVLRLPMWLDDKVGNVLAAHRVA